jgi:hypothetical protein
MIVMNVSIRKGYSVWSTETERVERLKELESKGIIIVKETFSQICRKCGHPNSVDEKFKREKRSLCNNCGKTILLSNPLSCYTISDINYKNIIRICNENLKQTLGEDSCTFDKQQRIWICSVDNQNIPVFISEVSSYNQYLGDSTNSAWLCILLDWKKEKGNIHYYNELHFVKLEDILNETTNLGEALKDLVAKFNPNVAIELNQRFDSCISSISPTVFEKEFIDNFLNAIRERSDLLKDFLNYLSNRRKTILNSKVVTIGGAGNPDFIIINLLEYLQEGLSPDKVGEAKRYCKSRFDIGLFGKAQAHALGEDTVSIVSTNNIQPEVWKLVWDTYKKEGRFKHVLLEKATLLLLINVLKMEYLFETTY